MLISTFSVEMSVRVKSLILDPCGSSKLLSYEYEAIFQHLLFYLSIQLSSALLLVSTVRKITRIYGKVPLWSLDEHSAVSADPFKAMSMCVFE